MNTVLKIFLSMSFSGGLLILVLILGNRLLKDKVSRQWQYYIWLVVVLRLLLPFGPETNLLGKTYRAVNQVMTQTMPLPQQQLPPNTPIFTPAVGLEADNENADRPVEDLTTAHPLQDIGTLLTDHIWLIWLMIALGLLTRKITIYQGFMRYIKAGSAPVSDTEMLDRLSFAGERAGIRKPVELCVNPLVSSPLLIGFFHPCIVLPSADISEEDFQYIALHELTHYKRRDMFYKWLVQVTVCLHWFNPLVHLMGREITKACEFSCDEAVLAKMGSAQDYGKTLLDAMAAVGKYKENPGAVPLSENTQLLKERISAIMNFKKKSTAIRLLTGVLTLCMILSAAFVGVYSAAAADVPSPANIEKALPAKSDNSPAADNSTVMETLELKGTTYYLVRSEAQLRAIGTGKYGMDQNYMQQADIQLSADEWVPIGTWDDPFTGSFNGNGFEIIGLTMTDPDTKIIGLFGVAKNAHIYNVTMRDYDITSAGRNVPGKSVGAILAVGQGSRSYDNFAYPKETIKHSQTSGEPLSGIGLYYELDSLPLFEIAFSRLDESAQKTWLERLYADDNFAFFSAAMRGLDIDSSLLADFAEKAYDDGEIAFFSTLSDCMEEAELELWLDRALEDRKWNFQSMLFNKLDRDDEFDELEAKQEKEWAEAQRSEYQAAGVTMDGKDYYYQGKLVNIFLDIRKEGSLYVLDINPKGTVNIKIIRDADDKIAGAAYMTDAEAASLLDDMDDDDDWQEASGGRVWHPQVLPVNLESIADNEIVWLGEYALSEGDRIWYDVSAETGNGLQIGFAKPDDEHTTYYSVKNLRQKDDALRCTVSFTFGPPAEPGTYQLFLWATDGALGNVKGSISIGFAADVS